jgi:hypothetical protein
MGQRFRSVLNAVVSLKMAAIEPADDLILWGAYSDERITSEYIV